MIKKNKKNNEKYDIMHLEIVWLDSKNKKLHTL